MKIILTIGMLIFGNSIYGQATTNELNTEQYNNIKVNGVLLTSIKETKGEKESMESLFGPCTIEESETDAEIMWRNFVYSDSFSFTYTDFNSNFSDGSLEHFETNNIRLKNVEVNIGDNISILGNDVVFNDNVDGTQSIVFTHFDYDCCPIIIKFDQVTKVITKIEYFVWT